jgi:superfamily II DNA/RNA helicase
MSGVSQRLYHVSGQESARSSSARSERRACARVRQFEDTAYEVTKRLETNGKKVVQLSRDSGRRSVLELIKKVKAGEVQFLVGTDGDAFGLYDSGIARIVNYDLPESGSDYTARFLKLALAGAQVRIDSFACERYVFNLERVEKFLGMKLPVERFEDSDLAEDKSDGMVFERERPEGRGRFDRRGPRDSSGRGDRRPGSPHRRSDQRSDRYDRGGDDRARRERVRSRGWRDARRRTDEASGGERRERPERRGGGDRYAGDRGKRPEPRRDSPAERRPAGGISARPVSLRPASLRPEHEERRPEPHKKAATLDERIKQYHEKYGEDFKVSPDTKEEKKGLFGKIASLFKRKS